MLYITSGGIRTVDQVAIGASQETNEEEGGQLSLIGTKESDGYMIDQIPGQNKYGCLRFFSDASISKEPMQAITFTYNNFQSPVLSIGDRSGGTDSRLYVRDIEGIQFGEDQAQLYLNFENRNGTINYGPISIVSPSLTDSTYTQLRIFSDDNLSGGLLLQNFAVSEEQPNEGFQLVQFNSIGEKGVIDFLFDQDNNPFINLFYTLNSHNAATFLERATFNKGIYLNTAPSANYNFTLNTHVNKNESQLVYSITNNDKTSSYTEWFFRDNTYTRFRHELNGGNGILTQFDLVSGEDENDKTSYANFNCKVISQNEFISNAIQSYRIIYGEYGTFWRQDGTDIYLMITNANDQYGTFNDLRPFCVTLSTGQVTLNNSLIITNDENKYVTISDNLGITNNSISTNSSINVGQDLIANGRIVSKHYFSNQNDNIDISTILNDETRIVPFLVNDKNGNTFFYSEVVLNGTNSIMGQLVVQSRDREKYPAISIGINESNNPYVKSNVPTIGENDDLARCDWIKNNFISVNGGIFSGELINTHYSSYRIVNGSYGTFWRNDGSSLYLMITNANDPYGTYNDFRPFQVRFSDGQVILNNSFIINSDGYTSIAGNMAISNSGITINTGISVNGMIDCQNIVNAKTYFRKTSTTLNKNNTYAQNTYDNDLIFTDSENRTIFRMDTFLGPTNNTGARLLTQSRDSSAESELALRWREDNTSVITWSHPTYGTDNELARCDWVKNQIGADVITIYNGQTGIPNDNGTDTSFLKILFKNIGNSGIIYGYCYMTKEAALNLKNNPIYQEITLSTKLYGYFYSVSVNIYDLITVVKPYYANTSSGALDSWNASDRRFECGLSSTGNFILKCHSLNTQGWSANDRCFIEFIGLCHV